MHSWASSFRVYLVSYIRLFWKISGSCDKSRGFVMNLKSPGFVKNLGLFALCGLTWSFVCKSLSLHIPTYMYVSFALELGLFWRDSVSIDSFQKGHWPMELRHFGVRESIRLSIATLWCIRLLYVAVGCSVLQCVAVCCSVLQCVAMCCDTLV